MDPYHGLSLRLVMAAKHLYRCQLLANTDSPRSTLRTFLPGCFHSTRGPYMLSSTEFLSSVTSSDLMDIRIQPEFLWGLSNRLVGLTLRNNRVVCCSCGCQAHNTLSCSTTTNPRCAGFVAVNTVWVQRLGVMKCVSTVQITFAMTKPNGSVWAVAQSETIGMYKH